MKDIFRKAWDCFLQYPALGLPSLLAAIVSRSFLLLQSLLTYKLQLALRDIQIESVLGIARTSNIAPTWLPALMSLIRFLLTYAATVVETLGTFITACLAYRKLTLTKPETLHNIFWSRSTGGVLWLSLFGLILAGETAALIFFTYFHVPTAHDYSSRAFQYLGYVQFLLSGLATGYLITPYLLRVIAKTLGSRQVQKETEQKARYAAMLMAVIAVGISFAITQAVLRLPYSERSTLLVAYIRSAIQALPKIVLAITFGLLLADSATAADVTSPISSAAPTP